MSFLLLISFYNNKDPKNIVVLQPHRIHFYFKIEYNQINKVVLTNLD